MLYAEHTNAICTRSNAGLRVELCWLPVMDIVGIQCCVDDRIQWASVPREKALDAFYHPMLYLSAAQVADLFPRRGVEDESTTFTGTELQPQ